MSDLTSGDTKDELALDIPSSDRRRHALAQAMIAFGTVRSGIWYGRRSSVARLLHRLLPHSTIKRAHGSVTTVSLGDAADLTPGNQTREERRLALRGAFLACGSLALGRRSGYHIEFLLRDQRLCDRIVRILATEGVTLKTTERRGRIVAYSKDAESIVTTLAVIGAHQAVMHMEELRAVRDTKNRIRRLVNTEAANLDRSTEAAANARDLISLLGETGELASASPALREAARLRLAFPSESLSELASRCSPPITKSAFNARIRSLLRLSSAGLVNANEADRATGRAVEGQEQLSLRRDRA